VFIDDPLVSGQKVARGSHDRFISVGSLSLQIALSGLARGFTGGLASHGSLLPWGTIRSCVSAGGRDVVGRRSMILGYPGARVLGERCR